MDIRLVATLRRIHAAVAVAVMLTAAAVLAGWMLEVPAIKSLRPGWASMTFNSALGLFMAAAALWLSRANGDGRRRRFAGQLAILVALLGIANLIQYLFGWNLGIDELLVQDATPAPPTTYPGRMSVNAAMSFLCIGIALALIDRQTGHGQRPSEWLAVAAAAPAFLALVGYAYGLHEVIGLFNSTAMALHTALAFLLLAAGVLAARSEAGFMRWFVSRSVTGIAARVLLPGSIGVLVALGFLTALGAKLGLYEPATRGTIFLVTGVGALLFFFNGAIGRLAGLEAKYSATLAELRRSNAELEEFAFIAAHDLQTPLRQVHSFANLLAKESRGRLGPAADEYLHQIVSGSQRMADLVKDVARFSRVHQPVSQQASAIDSELVLESVLSHLRVATVESAGEISHDPLPRVMGNPEQLRLLFGNLVENGLKFHRDGVAPRVHVSAEENSGEWIFCVRDNGIGIASRHHERIFRIFQRLHSRQAYPGTGMGLALCKRIVDQYGGRLWVESEEGQGAAFFFTLPKPAGGTRENAACPAMAAGVPAPASRQAKIIIADDRPVERDYLRTVLGYGGHTVLEASNGAQALALVRCEQPDLVITDLMMPDLDGYGLMQAIRADPRTAATPIIFCTATYHRQEAKVLATATGAARLLVKPVEPQALLDTVQDVLRQPAPLYASTLPPAEVERAYLQLLNDKLLQKTEELEKEVAARVRAEEELRHLYAEPASTVGKRGVDRRAVPACDAFSGASTAAHRQKRGADRRRTPDRRLGAGDR